MAYKDSEKRRLWKETNREKILEQGREYARKRRLADPERSRAQLREWRRNNRHKVRAWDLKRRFNLTPEQYQMLFTTQGGACAICRKEFGRDVKPHIDHDHATGKVRALLCVRCNVWMAPIDSDLLDALLAYKKKYSE